MSKQPNYPLKFNEKLWEISVVQKQYAPLSSLSKEHSPQTIPDHGSKLPKPMPRTFAWGKKILKTKCQKFAINFYMNLTWAFGSTVTFAKGIYFFKLPRFIPQDRKIRLLFALPWNSKSLPDSIFKALFLPPLTDVWISRTSSFRIQCCINKN